MRALLITSGLNVVSKEILKFSGIVGVAEFSPLGLLKLITMSGFEPTEVHFYNNRFKFIPSLLKQFTSSEVNIIAKKVATPEKQWRILTKIILSTQNKNSHH
jgi:hypothetical protein